MSIRNAIISLFVVQLLLVVSAIGWLSWRSGKQAVNEVATEFRSEIGERVRDHLRVYVETPRKVNALLLHEMDRSHVKTEDFTSMESLYGRVFDMFPETGHVYFGHSDGGFSAMERDPDLGFRIEATEGLSAGQLTRFAVNEDGSRANAMGSFEYDVRIARWYKAAADNGLPSWTKIYQVRIDPPALGLTAVTPILATDEETDAVVGTGITLQQLSDFLGTLKVGTNGRTFIVEHTGHLVATSSGEPLFARDKGQLIRKHAWDSVDPLVGAAAAHLQRSHGSLGAIRGELQDSFSLNGSSHLIQVTPYADPFGIDWLIVVAVPEADFAAGIDRNVKTTALLALVALLIAIQGGIMIARRIAQPLLSVAGEMETVSNFEFPENSGSHSKIQEVETIQDSLYRMKRGLQSFERYVSADVVRRVIKSDGGQGLGLKPAEITLFFSDITDFSSLSHKLEPDLLVQLLGDYLGEASNLILMSGGTVDKFVGDAIMAFWNAPQTVRDHPNVACEVALRCIERSRELESQWKERGINSVSYHIGLATGNALVGNVGSEQRMDFTAIGDNVTLASKLEALNRRFGTQVLLTDEMHELVKDKFVLRAVGRVLFSGDAQPTNLYELLGRAEKGKALKEQAELYNQALGVYTAGHFADAIARVEGFLRKYPDDVVAQRLLERCVLLGDAPPANWQGIERLDDLS